MYIKAHSSPVVGWMAAGVKAASFALLRVFVSTFALIQLTGVQH